MSVLHFNLEEIGSSDILGGKVKTLLTPDKIGKTSPAQVLAYSSFKPGESLRAHLHSESSEIYFVIRGNGTASYGPELTSQEIKSNDILFIPPRTLHAVRNTGKEPLEIAFFLVPGTDGYEEPSPARAAPSSPSVHATRAPLE
jgi:mannose-6-phosphate isomerase-like protein (cupin superfamily)